MKTTKFTTEEAEIPCKTCGAALNDHSFGPLKCPVDGQGTKFGFKQNQFFSPPDNAAESFKDKIVIYVSEAI